MFGTRPEAIKMCPVVLALRARGVLEPHLCTTGQHRQLLEQVLTTFDVTSDVDLRLMSADQGLADLTSRAISALDKYYVEHEPDLVLVQGDTTTAFCATLAAFYRRIPVAHVEAGLRTWNLAAPFPEEANRTLISRLAIHHFAPTARSGANLVREGVAEDRIEVTGNTAIDALQFAARRAQEVRPSVAGVNERWLEPGAAPLVLVTGHRRESFGSAFKSMCAAIRELGRRFPAAQFVYPVHPNPNIRVPAHASLRGLPNVHLIAPLEYLAFVRLMFASTLILTDSGGLQEEAPALGKPVLVMRDTTERPEALEAGFSQLVGTKTSSIVDAVSVLLTDPNARERMSSGINPFGDGKASERIATTCERLLGVTGA